MRDTCSCVCIAVCVHTAFLVNAAFVTLFWHFEHIDSAGEDDETDAVSQEDLEFLLSEQIDNLSDKKYTCFCSFSVADVFC